MSNSTLDGSVTPVVIPAMTIDQVTNGDSLFLLGTIDNLGTIFVDGTGTSAADTASVVLASPAVTLEGGGTLLFSGGFDALLYGSNASVESLVNVDNTIAGIGAISNPTPFTIEAGDTAYPIALTNEAGGVIDANGTVTSEPAGLFLNVANAALVNDGLLEATGVDPLFIEAATIDQSSGGTILASGSGDLVVATGPTSGVDIAGGTLMMNDGGTLAIPGATLDGSVASVTIAAGTDLALGSLYVLGTLDNLGTVGTTGSLLGSNQLLIAGASATLRGAGEVTDPAIIGSGTATPALINADNTIFGYGYIGAAVRSGGAPPAAVSLTNEAQGIIDATGGILSLYGGGGTLQNTGLLEVTAGGTLAIGDATLDNAGGTLLASGSGDNIMLATVDLAGGAIDTTGGGVIDFTGGSNTLSTGTAALVLSAAENVQLTGGTLTLPEGTLDNTGSFDVGGTLMPGGPTLALDGGGSVQLTGSILSTGSATLFNAETISGGGEISDGALALTNEAAGVIDGVGIDASVPTRNAGVLENVSLGFNHTTTIDDAGGTLLADGGNFALLDAEISGGTLAGTAGGLFTFGSDETSLSNVTLDGGASAVTIAAGATLQAYFVGISLPFYYDEPTNLTLTGTIDLLGTIESLNTGFGGSGTLSNADLLVGSSGDIDGSIINNGTLLAQSGLLAVNGNVSGSGEIVIAAGATFELGALSSQMVDFRGNANGTLLLDTPSYAGVSGAVPEYSGTLDNLSYGDALAFPGTPIKSASVVSGNTLAVTLIDASTLDYTFANLQAGTTFDLASATATPREVYDFSYNGAAGTGDVGMGEQGTGSFTIDTDSGTAALGDVTGFSLTMSDSVYYLLANLTAFTATFGTGDSLATLSFATGEGHVTELGQVVPANEQFEVDNLLANGATSEAGSDGPAGVISQGAITLTPEGELLSEVVVACFAEGTRIRTEGGERRVETLRAGDVVATVMGGSRRVVWVGHRRIACLRHPRPLEVMPVRVHAHAFGPDAPRADLLLSPDHAVFTGGVLIPVRYLVNGATILREHCAEITYWHLELDAHNAVLAENLACESYLDTGNRGAFVECEDAVIMHADFARAVWDARGFAPLRAAGAAVAAVRGDLLRHAEALGFGLTREPALRLWVDGRTLWPRTGAGGGQRFVLPAGARAVRLLSRAAVPAENLVSEADHRRLGVAVAALRADGRAVALDDARLGSGWHARERDWRWTDGDATLALSGARELDIDVAITARYWVRSADSAAAPAVSRGAYAARGAFAAR